MSVAHKAFVNLKMTDDLSGNLKKLSNAISRTIQIEALKAGAEPIRAEAEILAPRDETAGPPHLSENIVIQVPTERQLEAIGNETPVVIIGPSKDVFYGFFQEFGHGPGPAQPFMRPAFDLHVQDSLRIVQAHLWAALEKGSVH